MMPVSPQESLLLAKALDQAKEKEEIRLRNAYRCAYYAVHHAAKQALSRMSLKLIKAKKGGAHADVEVSLLQAGTTEAQKAVIQLRRLKRFRVDCDYHLEKSIDIGVAAVRLAEAGELFETLQAMGGATLAQTGQQ